MEPQEPIVQQPIMQPVHHKGKDGCFLAAVFISILLACGVGGGVYYYMDQKAKDTKADTDGQIQVLQQQVSDLKEAASWQTYINSTYGFSFKYPADWTISEQRADYGDARVYEISFDDESYYVTVFDMGDQTADEFVEDFYGGVESGPSDIENVDVNDYAVVKFFMQQSTTSDQTLGSTNYFFSSDATGVDISNTMQDKDTEDETLTKIVDSFEFQ